jgi:hypothetical protein
MGPNGSRLRRQKRGTRLKLLEPLGGVVEGCVWDSLSKKHSHIHAVWATSTRGTWESAAATSFKWRWGGLETSPFVPHRWCDKILGRVLPPAGTGQGCGGILIEFAPPVSDDPCKALVYPGTTTPGHIPTLMYR